MKKWCSLALVLCLTLCLFAGCTGNMKEETGKVYYLNFKPEADSDWILTE